jgi:uncharacterized protein (DUF111 family)
MSAGCSGDMTIAALIDCGFPFEKLTEIFHTELTPSVELSLKKVIRNSIEVKGIDVKVKEEFQHSHRHLSEIYELIDKLNVSEPVKENSRLVFENLATSEAKMHGIELERVHFHEVGACDSIVDIISIMVAFEYFGIEKVAVDKIPLPHGTIECQHGTIPNPAPATMNLLEGFEFKPVDIYQEMVTPTAAAVIKTFSNPEKKLVTFTPKISGMGAGSYVIKDTPGFLRISIGDGEYL